LGLTSFISSLELRTTVVVRSAVTGSDSTRVLMCQYTADKHDIPPSHFKLTLQGSTNPDLTVNTKQEAAGASFSVFDLTRLGIRTPNLPHTIH